MAVSAIALGGAALISCSQSDSGVDEIRRVAAPLTNGAASGVAEVNAVGALTVAGGCTATLIGPRTIIMAAHCMLPFTTECTGFTPSLANITVTFADGQGNPFGAGAQTIQVIGLAWHPDAYGNRFASGPNPSPTPACPGTVDAGPVF
jgi:hypothetical protein